MKPLQRGEAEEALKQAVAEAATHPRGAEGVADDMRMPKPVKAMFLMMVREAAEHGAGSVIETLRQERCPVPATPDQRAVLDLLVEATVSTGEALHPPALARMLGWPEEKVEQIAAELKKLGMIR